MTKPFLGLSGLLVVGLLACNSAASTPGPGASGGRTGSTPGAAASYARTQPGNTPAAGQAGSISGELSFPSEFLAAQAVYAISIDGSRFYLVESAVGQPHYTMRGVAAGDYYVLTVGRMPGTPGYGNVANERFGAAYTKSVLCGLSATCPDHSLVPVHVVAGRDTARIDPGDWYAGQDAYPLVPLGGPVRLTLPEPPAAFATSQEAAVIEAQARTGARYVTRQSDCAINAACVWFESSQGGQNAAYYLGGGGSNSDVLSCAFYMVGSDATGWGTFDVGCRFGRSAFPARGSTGTVQLGIGETGCVNVHAQPGITYRVVGCLADGTRVRIDGGPVYTGPRSVAGEQGSRLDLWWHIAGRGWMVHQYLFNG